MTIPQPDRTAMRVIGMLVAALAYLFRSMQLLRRETERLV